MSDHDHTYELVAIGETEIGRPNTITMRCPCGDERTMLTNKTPAEIQAEANA